jgi:cytochrome c peroxidase
MLRRLTVPAFASAMLVALYQFVNLPAGHTETPGTDPLDRRLAGVLRAHGFTGRIEEQLEVRLGGKIDPARAELGRLLFFDPLLGINLDNACAGCHSPRHGFGDSQPMAIGIDNNNLVGPHRSGPRNMRRTPLVINTAFYPRQMWNSRFVALADDPFDNSAGFLFPAPEELSLSDQPHLLTAQAFIPTTERNEMAGFQFVGDNDDMRAEVVERLNKTPNYDWLFRLVFAEIGPDDRITYDHLAAAIAEFEFSLTFANAPIDQFARGDHAAMTDSEKQGALLFFGKARCVSCHAVSGPSNEMFSDFIPHVIAVPQVAPRSTNSTFDGPDANEDFGLEQITGLESDRYRFRTSPLRNIAVQPAFFHNGAFTSLADAIAHHLDVYGSARDYSPEGRLPEDLLGPLGPIEPVLDRLDPRLRRPIRLTDGEFADLVQFVATGLLDPRATPSNLATLIPDQLPSELRPLEFETPD